MQTTIHLNRLSTIVTRTAALAFFTVAGTIALNAQQSSGAAEALPPISLKTSLIAPLDMSSSSSSDDYGYNSNTGTVETAKAEGFTLLAGEDQPPPRRRYGRPNYSDSHTNSDGSNKYTFMVGGGFTLPTGGTHNYATPGWKIQVGGGRNFNKTLAVLVQFDYDKLGIQTNTLNNLLSVYNSLGASDQNGDPLTQLGGYIHDWSLSLDPVLNYYTSDSLGAYVTGGAGFYHKATVFTTPEIGQYCDPYYGCYTYQANQPIDKYVSNAFGVNAGFGFTYKLSRWANQRLYAEARYVWTDNKPRPCYDGTGTNINNCNGTPLSPSYFNVFPQASARTTYIPVTFGIRF
jgi:hypothetical protein